MSTIEDMVKQLTLDEKVRLCRGFDFWRTESVERLGIKQIMMSDGPHGVRLQRGKSDHLGFNDSEPATCFPTACATGSSFDRKLLNEIGSAIGSEAAAFGVSVVLGPGVNLKRHPLCGRNFEYFSEDPFVSGELGVAFVKGVQSQGVGTSVKHFAVNNQERARFINDSVVDERTLRELYLPAFEAIVKKSKPWTVMCSYNKVNGDFACENKYLLTDILRNEWGFDGLVVTDWGAVNDRLAGIIAGLDLEMPYLGLENDKQIIEAVNNGTLTETALDRCVERIVRLAQQAQNAKNTDYCQEKHHVLARTAEEKSAVLLKNEVNTLPIKVGARVAVIGGFAREPRYQGAGSSRINPFKVDEPLNELKMAGYAVEYAEGYAVEEKEPDFNMIAEAVRIAGTCEYAVIFAGLPPSYESEGFDRKGMSLPRSHTELIHKVAAANPNTVVVLMCGAPVELPWQEEVKTILVMYLGGEAVGGACANLLTGKANPSGKLAETWPIRVEDVSSNLYFSKDTFRTEYRESLFVGYRWYDTAKRSVAYPFGHGLSYTEFVMGNAVVSSTQKRKGQSLDISIEVENTGKVYGAEVVQLYIRKKKSAIMRADKVLRGFEKVYLEPQESERITFTLTDYDFHYYDVDEKGWRIEAGEYEILLGNSSRNIAYPFVLEVEGDEPVKSMSPPVYMNLPQNGSFMVPDEQFEALFCGLYKKPIRIIKPYHFNSVVQDLNASFIGRLILKQFQKQASAENDSAEPNDMNNMLADINEYPLRAIAMTKTLNRTQIMGLVDILNGRFGRGFSRFKQSNAE